MTVDGRSPSPLLPDEDSALLAGAGNPNSATLPKQVMEHTELVWPHEDRHACFVRCLRCGWCSMRFLSVDVALEVAERHENGVAMLDCRPRGKGNGVESKTCTALTDQVAT